jgi:hypothetical protein
MIWEGIGVLLITYRDVGYKRSHAEAQVIEILKNIQIDIKEADRS